MKRPSSMASIARSFALDKRPQSSFRIISMDKKEAKIKQSASLLISKNVDAFKYLSDQIDNLSQNQLSDSRIDEMKSEIQHFKNFMHLKTAAQNFKYDYAEPHFSYHMGITREFINQLIDQKSQLNRTIQDQEHQISELQQKLDDLTQKYDDLQSQYLIQKNVNSVLSVAQDNLSKSQIQRSAQVKDGIKLINQYNYLEIQERNKFLYEENEQMKTLIEKQRQRIAELENIKQENNRMQHFIDEIQLGVNINKEYIKNLICDHKEALETIKKKDEQYAILQNKNSILQNELQCQQQLVIDQKQILYSQKQRIEKAESYEQQILLVDSLKEQLKIILKANLDLQHTNNTLTIQQVKQETHTQKLQIKLDKLHKMYSNDLLLTMKRLVQYTKDQLDCYSQRIARLETNILVSDQEIQRYEKDLNNQISSLL